MADPIVGSTVTLEVKWTDIAGDPVSASTVLYVLDPTGTETTPAVSNPTVGTYRGQVVLDEAGIWRYRWEAESSEGVIVCEGAVCARASAFVTAS